MVKVAITGSSGLIGTALVTRLQASGHEVLRLVRRAPRFAGEVRWDPETGDLDPKLLAGVDAVVNLAGAGVGDKRWSDSYKQTILTSRVDSTRTLVTAMLAMDTPPRVLVSGSAQGFYGDRGDEELTEASPGGDGFLADVVRAWEAEAVRAADGGVRVALARTGLVMAPDGGAFGKLLPLIKLGLGGPLGNGRQWWSWITMTDQVAALEHLIRTDVSGPVNLCAPQPARNREVVAALGRAFGRPTLLPAPGFALRIAVGEFSSEILASTRMAPDVLARSGFGFRHPDLDGAARWLAERR